MRTQDRILRLWYTKKLLISILKTKLQTNKYMNNFTVQVIKIVISCCCDHLKFQFQRYGSSNNRSPGSRPQTFLLPFLYCVALRFVVGLGRCYIFQKPQEGRQTASASATAVVCLRQQKPFAFNSRVGGKIRTQHHISMLLPFVS